MSEEKLLVLNPDQQAVAAKQLKEAVFGLHHISQLLEKGELDETLCRAVLSSAEYSLAKFTDVTGIETESKLEVEERHSKLRAANMRVHELEQQIGAQTGPQEVQLGVRALADRLRDWWEEEGLAHVSEFEIGTYGVCRVKLSCAISTHGVGLFSDTPVSDKEQHKLWLESLSERGFVLVQDRYHERGLVDCEASRQTLIQLIQGRMPSAKVVAFENRANVDGDFTIWRVEVVIRDLADMAALPVKTPGAGT